MRNGPVLDCSCQTPVIALDAGASLGGAVVNTVAQDASKDEESPYLLPLWSPKEKSSRSIEVLKTMT